MIASPQRLYIITGKGGVGKTVVSLAFTRWLRQQGHDATHVTFGHHRLQDSSAPTRENPLAAWADVPRWALDLEESAEGYISKRIGSVLAAKWIVRTAFFRALVNMMPGFSYVIFLGRLLQAMQDQPQRVMVLDAPASGHALAMLEATANFREIFGAGAVYEDTQKMISKLYDPAYTGVRILALPTQMAMQEATELREAVAQIAPFDARIFLNQSLEPWRVAL
jgi:arsenite-transporting ATPase